ncbi:hypothetical protein Tco_0640437 [Tanacetum coccineum]
MTGNKAYLAEYQDFNGGHVAFGGSKGYITGKGKIKTRKLDFEDVCFVKELQHFNLFSMSQICDKNNKVLFTDSECLVLSPEFKLPDANQVLLRIPRQNNMYSFNLENIVPSGGKGPTWLFDLDYLTDSMDYQPVRSENEANKHVGPQETNQNAGTKENIDAGDSPQEAESAQDYFVLPIWSSYTSTVKSSKASKEPTKHPDFKQVDKDDQSFEIPALEEIYDNPTDGIFTNSSYDDEGAVADFTNLEPVVNVSPIPTPRINSIHPSTLILGDPQSAVQTRSKVTKSSRAYILLYLKGKPKLGLWYPRVSSFDLEAYSDSDYARANLDRKSTTGGCQFIGRRLISWQCKKQTIVATSTTEAEYVATSLGRALDGTEALLLPKLFILWLAKVSTNSVNLVPLGKDSTAIETLKKIPPRGRKSAKVEPSVHKDPLFDELPDDTLD